LNKSINKSDNFVDTLKHMSNLSEDDAEEEVKTEMIESIKMM
jgi:hypothetical protein